jgi:hypothetical protein
MSSVILGCGCHHTMADGFGCTEYVRCDTHYDSSVDDAKILEAAKNKRAFQNALYDLSKTKEWDGVAWVPKHSETSV